MEGNIENKILELKANEKFTAMIKETETATDVQKVFAQFGVDLAEETIEQAMAFTSKPDGEIEEDDLEAVCGGVSLRGIIDTLYELFKEYYRPSSIGLYPRIRLRK